MIVLGLVPASVTGATLFSDGFESGDFTTGGWTTQNSDASVSKKAEYEGTYGAKLAKTTWIEKAVSTAGYSSIHVKYYRMTKNFDAGEYLYVEWYDGTDWNELESTQVSSWGSRQDMTCGSGANDNSNFKVRFRTNAGSNNESAYVDTVEVTGVIPAGVAIVESGGSTDVSEEGPTTDTYTVVLDTQPTDTVTITVDPDVETEVNNNGAGNSIDLTFLTTNWDTAQTVTVKAIDDYSAEGAHTSIITHTAASNDNDYDGISIDDVVANVTDNDIAGVTIVESGGSTDVNEEGPTSDTYTVVLDTQPTDTVTINVDPDTETEVNNNGAGNSINLTFLTTNWDTAQTVTVKAIDDGDSEGAHTSTITHTSTSNDNDYDSISIDDVVANITDNDFPPGQASEPSPADDANDVNISTDLSWAPGADTLSHDVYFGVDFNDVNDANTVSSGIFKGNQDSNSYDPGLLALSTAYHWRIDEKNSVGTTKGNVWSFSTSIDTDADNIADTWESQYGLDPNDANDADLDLDSDNYNNLSEYLHDSDPNDSNSVPSVNITINVPTNVSTIQRAINAGIDGDTIMVSEGSYYENINFSGRAVSLTGTDPNDPNVVASTIIDANNTSLDVAVFNSGEDANSVIDGITLTGGRYGIYCASSSAPTVQRCVTRNNSNSGVRASSASPTVSDCEISQNNYDGLQLTSSAATITRCRILSNTNRGIYCSEYSGTIQNCVIAKNGGYGLYCQSSSASIINCTIVSNTTYGIYGAFAQVKNCIVWDNTNDLHSCTATYSCIEDQDSGTGVIHGDPLFVDTDNDDYHLWYASPCIDAGDPNSVYTNEPNGGGGRIDMGAYGNTAEATTIVDEDSDGLADAWEATYWPGQDPNLHDPNDDPDADGLRNKDEYYINWDPNSDDSGSFSGLVRNERVDVNFPSVSLAMSMAENTDTLIMDPNTYYEQINFNGKPVHLRSTDPNDPNVVAATIIDANGVGNGVTFSNAEDANSIIQGLTIRNAQSAWWYAGINCTNASPAIRDCVLRNNYSGIYLDHSTAEITNCQGIYNSHYGLFIRYSSSPTIASGIFSHNDTYGVFADDSEGVINNSVMAKNSNAGLRVSSGSVTVLNCTIADNTTYGIYATSATEVKNCILWNNSNDLYNCSATFSCIEDADTGRGNIYADPLFQDADANDFHLDANSPCIDTGVPWFDYSNEPSPNGGRINMGAYGNTSEAMTSTDVDSDNISDAWEAMYWPGDDPNLHDPNDNPDGDSLTNLSEYLFGTDPNTSDPNETLWIAYGALSTSKFDPTQGQTLTIEYWTNIDANAVITIADANDPNNIARTISQAATVGLNQWIWDGQDVNSLIVEDGFYDVSVDANDGVDTAYYDCGTGELDYLHAITNVNSNPYRFIATNNEITTITYDLTVDANMVVTIYDPNGLLFRTLTAPQADPNEVVWDGRNKDASQSDSRYIIKDGSYKIEVRYEGMREKEEGIVTVYK